MNTSAIAAIDRACVTAGGVSALARILDVKPPTISEWRSGKRPVPVERCVEIERATGGSVRRWDLRPTDWYRLWPEIITADGAPSVPTERAA